MPSSIFAGAGDGEVQIAVGREVIDATSAIPEDARGMVVFAHGSGSSRFSSRNQSVAVTLQHARFGTLLLDLLTRSEEARDVHTGELRFDIPLLADRVVRATNWLSRDSRTRSLPIGYFGASTGAAAALVAAAERPHEVQAVVSRGGRPDLAAGALPRVGAPTLLIVGSLDFDVIRLNEMAVQQMRAPAKIAIVRGASHLFEETGALGVVADLAREWFVAHLAAPASMESS